ncbi:MULTISPECIES: dTDP-4-dehydrorhamnose reductase [unclassified Thermosynechococcus]|uniref:dTDP-4-dehydrorhamnose reductase n=1 Tax=unclassified Thermosynechococcus TaxID=2622553 RepID=UPI0028562F06|nr:MULTISPECIES: dTDP-4-dehydrorhamnose reductase [unclassified Thermosynechococcus]MDR5639525.1 dTDP-4-dehydrorhamnose reductase [Thermosynechococcus sp. PP42]MDR7921801.1 dTDP-4-dehydrorhamnose reductase [Thermosynechococcus sp. HY213]WNC31119.1 dTDP-4-dehydrorhamnose reductase [Thermosynechococcus sp. PKX82]
MRLVILGATGQVGWQLVQQAPQGVEVIPIARQGTAVTLDLEDLEAIPNLVKTLCPDVVINAAAYTAVDQAEQEPERAQRINGTAVGLLAETMASLGGLLIHYSTDYVFAGTQSRPYRETDATAPLNAYGYSKWLGEQAIATHHPAHLILRTSWVYDLRGKNFLRTMVRLAQTRPVVRVVADQIGTPTAAPFIAQVTYQLLEHWQVDSSLSGLYHLTPRGSTSWYGFAVKIFDHLRAKGYATATLEAIPSSEYPTPAKRPAFSTLNCEKLEAVLGTPLPPWEAVLQPLLDQLDPQSVL